MLGSGKVRGKQKTPENIMFPELGGEGEIRTLATVARPTPLAEAPLHT